MDQATLRNSAFAMPPSSPAFPPGPYRFVDREYFIIRYRTNLAALRRVMPEPLEVIGPVVNYEFIRMPDSTGFGDYTESGQVIPVRYQGQAGGYTHQMFLTDHPPIAAGRYDGSTSKADVGRSGRRTGPASWSSLSNHGGRPWRLKQRPYPQRRDVSPGTRESSSVKSRRCGRNMFGRSAP